MVERHLITGATGFVGGAIALELLARTDAQLVCIVRDTHGEPTARLQRSLATAATAYARSDLLPDVAARTIGVAGDMVGHLPAPAELGHVEEVWHCAASLRYEDRHAFDIDLHNVEGTRRILQLAEASGASTFNYISTAYVAGTALGHIAAEGRPGGVPLNNHYERSKLQAETLVAGASGLDVRVLRPSVVIGHSRTHAVTSFSGMYGFLRELALFRRQIQRRLGDLLALRPIRIRAEPDARINLIPVDEVARQAVTIATSDTMAGYFHLTNPTQAVLGDTLRLAFHLLDMRAPLFARSSQELNTIDQILSDRIPFYGSYMTGTKLFDRASTDAALGEPWAGCDLAPAKLSAYMEWYLPQIMNSGGNRWLGLEAS